MNLADLVIPPWVRLAAVAVLAAALIGCGWWLGGLGPRAELADERTARANDKATWEKQRADGEAAARRREGALQTAADRASEGLANANRTIAEQDKLIREQGSRIARLDVDAGRLRNQLAAYAAGAGSQDSLGACQARAGTLGRLLAESDELLAEVGGLVREGAQALAGCAVDHRSRAAEVEALVKAWPMNHAPAD